MKNRYLVLGVASLVAIDIIILVTYTLVEGLMGNLVTVTVQNKEKTMDVEGVSYNVMHYETKQWNL